MKKYLFDVQSVREITVLDEKLETVPVLRFIVMGPDNQLRLIYIKKNNKSITEIKQELIKRLVYMTGLKESEIEVSGWG
ncbi:MAG: hypothetical protein J7J61_03680 [Candidatus Hydrothermae bacterium]|nr:hypothetical protein [Candidatus Hydrothermae bacterium]